MEMRGYLQSCSSCGFQRSDSIGIAECPRCGKTLKYLYRRIREIKSSGFLDSSLFGMWKYHQLLPVDDLGSCVTLGEGGTPLTDSHRLRSRFGFSGRLLLKDETQNPTGTYKDRPASIGVTKALETGSRLVAVASDGNAGPAVAAYSARAGLDCLVVMPEDTPMERNIQAVLYGARLILVKESTVSECIDLVNELSGTFDWTHLTTAAAVNPYHIEGTKTIAYEIAEDLGWSSPDWVIVPAGGAGLAAATWKGFLEMKVAGMINKLPRLLVVQAKGCAPVVRAFIEKKRRVERWEKPNTKATAIGVPYPLDGDWALEAIEESGGYALTLSDEEMNRAAMILARSEGVFAESTGAASVAGFARALEEGVVGGEETVVAVVTGSGLKSISLFGELLDESRVIGRDSSDLNSVVDEYMQADREDLGTP